jgi:hypothetical protein
MEFLKKKYWVMIASLLFIIFSVGAGGWVWNTYGPAFEELKNKDPEEFSIILAEIKNLNLLKAGSLAIELNQMTPNQVQWNRYRRLKQKILSDDNFRQEVNAVRKGVVERARAEQNKYHSLQISDTGLQPDSTIWHKMDPWKKGLVLRETCQRILSKDKKLPANYCDQAIPLGREDRFVARALENLKLEMDYFDFSRLLSQAGIPAETAISQSGKLLKMTGSLAGA